MIFRLLAALLPNLLVLILPAFSQPHTTLRVPQDHRTIQSAINAARVGDTVLVDRGLYYENLHVNRNIVLASRFILDGDTTHISQTIIDGSKARNENQASAISIGGNTDTNCVVFGLTIQGGMGTVRIDPNTPWCSWRYGGGIDVSSHGATVSWNRIVGNSLSGAGGIDTVNGGGVFFGSNGRFRNDRYFILYRNVIADNHLDAVCCQGGGVYAYYNGRIVNNVIEQNTHSSQLYNNGGGICLSNPPGGPNATIDIIGNRIQQNSAPQGAGIYAYGFGLFYPIVNLTNNIIWDNHATGEGGGVKISRNAQALLVHNTIINNTAAEFGGGVETISSEVILLNNIVWNNSPRSRFRSPTLYIAKINILEGASEEFGNMDADPQLILEGPRYRLSPGSPALGSGVRTAMAFGTQISAPATDATGAPRCQPRDSNPDLGALEFRASGNTSIADRCTRISALLSYTTDSAGVLRPNATYIVNDSVLIQEQTKPLVIDVSPSKNSLALSFLKRYSPQGRRARYDFFVEGLETGANTNEFSRTEQFLDLEPGTYRVTIGTMIPIPGTMVDKVDYHRLDIRVGMPWYRTPLAYAAYALLGVLILTGITIARVRRYQTERIARQRFSRMQIESQESERKRLAAELHDGLGQNLLLASNELQQYLQQHDGTREGVEQAARLLQESIHSVREMASNLHPHQIERLGFCAAVKSMAETVAHATGLSVNCQCDDVDGLLAKEAEVQLYRIVQEALSNVAHHASAHKTDIEIRKGPSTIEAVVRDDGKGFDPETTQILMPPQPGGGSIRGFGLPSMTERARILGGELRLQSSPGNGTTISVTFPYS